MQIKQYQTTKYIMEMEHFVKYNGGRIKKSAWLSMKMF